MAKKASTKKTVSSAEWASKTQKAAAGAWKKARTTTGNAKGRSLPVMDGAIGEITEVRPGFTKEGGHPYLMLNFVVIEPEEAAGLKANKLHFIKATEWKTIDDKLADLVSDLKLLDPSEEFEERVNNCELAELLPIAQELKGVQFEFNSKKFKDDGDPMVFIQGRVEDFEPSHQETTVEEEDNSTTGGGDGNGGEGEWFPEVGEEYRYQDKVQSVVSVDSDAQTVVLKTVKAPKKTTKDVPWDDLEFNE